MIQTLTLGPITFHLYGLILGLAMLIGWGYAAKLARQAGVRLSDFDKIAWPALGGGIFGARIYHVVDYWWYYQSHLAEILAVWSGGLGIWGAVMGGAVGILASIKFQKTYKIQKLVWIVLDAAAAALPLAQAIGRWGNFVNTELFGKPTNLPWKLWIPELSRPSGYFDQAYYHPLFLYESILNLILFFILREMQKRSWVVGRGKILGGYLIGYGLIRIILEPFRIEAWRWGGLFTAQWFGLAAIVGGVMILKIRIKKIECRA